jgi:hypothetical protein
MKGRQHSRLVVTEGQMPMKIAGNPVSRGFKQTMAAISECFQFGSQEPGSH